LEEVKRQNKNDGEYHIAAALNHRFVYCLFVLYLPKLPLILCNPLRVIGVVEAIASNSSSVIADQRSGVSS
jgi:hypothetical protein